MHCEHGLVIQVLTMNLVPRSIPRTFLPGVAYR
jgi:hypothetical protein